MKIVRYLLVPIALILLLSTACAGTVAKPTLTPTALPTAVSTTSAVLSTAAQTSVPLPTSTSTWVPTQTPIPSPTEIPVYGLGQLVQVNELGLAILKVVYVNQRLVITLAARNNGLTVPPFISEDQFHVFQEGSQALQNDLCAVATPYFFGFLQPGDILMGTLCRKGAAADSPIRVEYHDPNNRVLATWKILKPGEAPVPAEIAEPDMKAVLHQPGEAVPVMGFTVTLDKMTVTARRQNNETYVYTQFIYENKGASDVTIPKNFTGNIVIKTSNGESIVSTIQESGCASTNLDDLVLKPGKNIEVNLCFLTAGTSPQPGGRVILIYRSVGDLFDFINWTIK